MRKFNINVDGKSYLVEVEEVSNDGAVVAPQAVVKPAVAVAQPVAKAAAPILSGEGTPLKSPMPGVVLNIKVANGAKVKKGDVILVLEAMKMENDIAAPQDGIVNVVVSKGANVDSGAVLFTIA